MRVQGSVALVTGANRGLGRAFVLALLEAGAAKVYAGARDPGNVEVTDPRVIPLRLDITDPGQVAAAAETASDVDIVVNNAGVSRSGEPLIAFGRTDQARAEMETNFFGPLNVTQAFAPVLARNGGGALVNMLSVLSWFTMPAAASYSATKAAAWSLTNATRLELQDQGTLVVGVHAGYIDTEMVAHINAPKITASSVAEQTIGGIEAGAIEVLVDDVSRGVRRGLSGDLRGLYPSLA